MAHDTPANFMTAVRAAWRLEAEPPRGFVRWAISAGGVILALGVIAGQVVGQPESPAWIIGLDIVVGVAGAVALPAALRRPTVAALGFIALTLLSPAATPLAGAALLWLARYSDLGVSIALVVVGAIAQVGRALWRQEAALFGWWLVTVVAGYAAVVGWGAWSKARSELLESLVDRVRRAEDEQAARVLEARRAERTRIAREMHDVLAHRLSLLATYAGAVEYNPDASTEQLIEAAAVIRGGAHDALEDLRHVIEVLRAEDDVAGGRGAAPPEPTLADLPKLVEESRRAGMTVTIEELDAEGGDADVPTRLGRTAFRLVQEALTNARKHAPDEPVHVAIAGRAGTDLTVEVLNPTGDHRERAPGAGTGLVGMAERARLAGGHLEAGPTGSGQFRVHARLPWPS